MLGPAAVFVVPAIYSQLAEKCGEERSLRYADLEAGHAAQNLLLQAAAGLATVPVGTFHDDQDQTVLSLPWEQSPLYLIPVGADSCSRVSGSDERADQSPGERIREEAGKLETFYGEIMVCSVSVEIPHQGT
jgi:hypothetical protein